jgi:hypothetical protein
LRTEVRQRTSPLAGSPASPNAAGLLLFAAPYSRKSRLIFVGPRGSSLEASHRRPAAQWTLSGEGCAEKRRLRRAAFDKILIKSRRDTLKQPKRQPHYTIRINHLTLRNTGRDDM